MTADCQYSVSVMPKQNQPKVEHIGASGLRALTAKALRESNTVYIIHDTNYKPMAVLMPYSEFQEFQSLKAAAEGGRE